MMTDSMTSLFLCLKLILGYIQKLLKKLAIRVPNISIEMFFSKLYSVKSFGGKLGAASSPPAPPSNSDDDADDVVVAATVVPDVRVEELLLVIVVAAANIEDADDAVNVDEVAATVLLALLVICFDCDGGRLLANTGDDSISLTKFEGKTPILFFKRPRHQPSST
ncbi:hypothetical protein FF38_00453 [Lucilia cuprina]|uniref:Uncharacterized protein n=1 Tax=Lucilia cuprina TaxID=7375 RepID=A0A0L0BKX0_LUCCU|nr:hypothetical protein FF38_00453 [Lucilia cuprina]